MRFFISENTDALSRNAAAWIVDRIRFVLRQKKEFTLVLSGGSTPEKLYSLLSSVPYDHAVDWNRVIFFWGDERFVPASDPQNNASMAKEHLLDPLKVPADHIRIIPTTPDPATAAAAYERTIRSYFGDQPVQFDLVLLGLGDNAHTLSLFPGQPVVHEQQKMVDALYLPELKQSRITMTAPIVNQASTVVFLISGAGKAKAVQQVWNGPEDHSKYPAQTIKPVNGKLFVFADTAAASLLE